VTISIIPTTTEHVQHILNTLRDEDRYEIEAAGVDPQYALYKTFECCLYSKTALVDGTPAAFWGVAGIALSDVGTPFLLTGNQVKKVSSVRFARIYKNEINEMKQLFPCLENYVDANYIGAVKMLRIAGFSLEEPIKVGKAFYQKFSLKDYSDV